MSEPLEAVHTDSAPAAIGPYSQAMRSGQWLFVSGQIPLDPATGRMVEGGFAAEAERALANLGAILTAAGCEKKHVIKATVFLTDMARFAEFNEVYAGFFGDHRPARAVVQVSALPRGAQVEIEAVAVR